MTSAPLRIDIVSDVMCPWCIIGYRQLVAAAEATGTEIDVHWHPFELNPQMPFEGQNLLEHVMEKYGATREGSKDTRSHMKAVGDELGFDFNFSDDSRMHNTFQTHQLIAWAKSQSRGDDLKQAFFVAHFTDQRDLSDPSVLCDVAGEIGLDRDIAVTILDNGTFADIVRTEQRSWTDRGVRSVPTMVFNNKHAVAGAQGVDNFTNILTQLKTLA